MKKPSKTALRKVVSNLQSQQPQGAPQEPVTQPVDLSPRQGVGIPPDQFDPSVTHIPPVNNPGAY